MSKGMLSDLIHQLQGVYVVTGDIRVFDHDAGDAVYLELNETCDEGDYPVYGRQYLTIGKQ